MKYQGIRKVHEGRFITRYDVDYVTAEGHAKTYEIISRNGDIRTLAALQNKTPDSVIMILTDESGERILVNREYRMAMAQWIYNFPAGLIDPGETPEQSAKRELWEETGLTLTAYRCRGLVTFVSDEWPTEYMHLFTGHDFTGELSECSEGELVWVPLEQRAALPTWAGDRIFLRLLEEDRPFFSLKLVYTGEALTAAVLDGRPMAL